MKNSFTGRILFIESDMELAGKLSEDLKKLGFSAIIAGDKSSALHYLQTYNPDVILLDLEVDRETELLKKIKSLADLSQIPVIAILPASGAKNGFSAVIPEFNDYIRKPFDAAEAYTRIKLQLTLLQTQKQNRELMEKNLILQQMTLTDGLTGLYNRWYVLNKLCAVVSHSARYQEPICFILLDIDHFKRVNDIYGHLFGDAVLKEVADHIRKSVRESDIAIRYGGEEFLVVCTNTENSGAKVLAERIRKNIKNAKFTLNGKTVRITVSLGISSGKPTFHSDPHLVINKLIEWADIALYKAKSNGRNRVETYHDSSCSSTSDEGIVPCEPLHREPGEPKNFNH